MSINDITRIGICSYGLAPGWPGPLARRCSSFSTERGQRRVQFCFRTSLSPHTMTKFTPPIAASFVSSSPTDGHPRGREEEREEEKESDKGKVFLTT